MNGTKRIKAELQEVRDSFTNHTNIWKQLRNLTVNETNLLNWDILLLPDNPPYNKGAFKIEINFPIEYPFKPPKIFFKTKIYHPNVNDKGHVCLPIIHDDHWKPDTRTEVILQYFTALVNQPEPQNYLVHTIAVEYFKEKEQFMRTAEDHTLKFAEKRPKN